jgi:two-component system sensor histidine kinase KdpD
MANQHHRVSLPIASPTEIERTASQLAIIRERFLTLGSSPVLAPRRIILDSWLRCGTLRVNASRRCAPLAVVRETQLCQLIEAHELLARAAAPVIAHLVDFLAESGYVTVLSNASGHLLEVAGDRAIRRQLARIDFIPGGDWSEGAAGTNAIGTAIASGHAVQLMAAEHYCDGWQDLTCTAVPIRHPLTGGLLGILDVTGNYRLIRPFLTSFLSAAALEITQNVRALLAPPPAPHQRLFVAGAHLPASQQPYEVAKQPQTAQSPYVQADPQPATASAAQLEITAHERRTRDAEQLAAAVCSISASLDLATTLEKVAEQTAQLFQLECAAACIFDEHGEIARRHVWSQPQHLLAESRRAIEAVIFQKDMLTLLYEYGEPVLIDDLRTSGGPAVIMIDQADIRAIALLPLATARGVLGVVAVPRPVPYHWEADDVRLGLTLTAQAATALENAWLFAALQQHTHHIEALNAVGQFLSTLLNPDQRLDPILEHIVEITQLDAGQIVLCDQRMNDLMIVAHYGMQAMQLGNQPPRLLSELAGRVIETGESLLICGIQNTVQARELAQTTHFCDLVVVPLIVGSTILGVLEIGSSTHRSLTNDDLKLFTTIGQQLGMALKNAQLLRAASEMDALRETDRLKSEFLTAVSHDLRSPLTAIRASVENLLDRDGIQSAHDQEHLLHNIAGQASRLGRLVDQLLDLSRIEAGALALDRDWTELAALIEDVITKFEQLNPDCLITYASANPLLLQYIDPDSLTQVFWNLLENACKYASPHAPIAIKACCSGNEVVISVADSGPGIPANERGKIFQPFYRLHRHKRTGPQGSGLGLAICRGIIEAHGGRIWVEVRIGGGSVFQIALPIPADDPIGYEMIDNQAILT